VLATVFAFVDKQILVVVVEPMKHDLALRDIQIGELQGLAPALFAILAVFPLAWLADRFERSKVLLGCALFWSMATAACAFADGFAMLLACRIAVAVGEAALVPIVYSLIPDLFSGQSRIRANLLFFGASVLGIGLGLTLAGAALGFVESIRPALPEGLNGLAGWRLAFLAVALPGPPIALAIALIGTTRRTVAQAEGPGRTHVLDYLRAHRQTVVGVYLSGGFSTFVAFALFAWLPSAIVRAFNGAPETVGASFGMAYVAGSVVGLGLAAVTASFWRRWAGTAAVPRARAVTSLLAIIPMLLIGVSASASQAYILIVVLVALVTTGAALSPTMLQDMAPPAIRARIISGVAITSAILGGIGPVAVGALSDAVAGHPRGLMWAIVTIATIGFLFCALCYRLVETPLRRTVAALEGTESEG